MGSIVYCRRNRNGLKNSPLSIALMISKRLVDVDSFFPMPIGCADQIYFNTKYAYCTVTIVQPVSFFTNELLVKEQTFVR